MNEVIPAIGNPDLLKPEFARMATAAPPSPVKWPRLMDLNGAARYLGRSPAEVHAIVERHNLPVTKLGGSVQLDRLLLDRLISQATSQPVRFDARRKRARSIEDIAFDAAMRAVEGAATLSKGFVYFVGCGRAVKIGFAVDVAARIDGSQTFNPVPLQLLGSVRGNRETEATLHRAFAKYRIEVTSGLGNAREWFWLEGAVWKFIYAVPKV